MKLRAAVIAVITAFAVAVAQADVTVWDSVPANRTAIITFDAPTLFDAPAVKALDEAGYLQELDAGLAQFEEFTGFNLRRDLQLLVVAKLGEDKKNDLAFLQGRFDKTVLLAALAQAQNYSQAAYGDTTIHTWHDQKENRQKHGAFLAGDLIVIGPEDGVKAAIDTRAKPGSGFNSQPGVAKAMAGINREYAVWLISREVGKPNSPLRNKVSALVMTLDLSQSFALTLSAEANDAMSARLLNVFATGVVAVGKLAADKPEAQLLADNASVGQDGNTVTLSVNIPNDKFTAWLLEKAKAKQAKN
jgi:hypothetical protein